jgi:hypothetical protein
MSFVMPLRCRVQFTTNALPTALLHADRDHEVILVLDKCPLENERKRRPISLEESVRVASDDEAGREVVYRWIDSHARLLDEHRVRILEFHGDESFWTGGLRMSGALNMGVKASTTDWIVGVGDEDLIFMPGWDTSMWRTLGEADPDKCVANMAMVTLQEREPCPETLTADWIHAQRSICSHYLTYPVAPRQSDPRHSRFSYAAFSRFFEVAKVPGVIEEACGVRSLTHWVPELMHKTLLHRVGGWPTSDASAFGPDIVQDDAFHAAGVRRRMATDHMVVHAKHFLYMSEDWDRVWTDPSILSVTDVI